jgi:hypothetical protein
MDGVMCVRLIGMGDAFAGRSGPAAMHLLRRSMFLVYAPLLLSRNRLQLLRWSLYAALVYMFLPPGCKEGWVL